MPRRRCCLQPGCLLTLVLPPPRNARVRGRLRCPARHSTLQVTQQVTQQAQVTQGGGDGTGSAAKSAKGPEAPADPETCEGQGYDGPLGASQGARLLGSEGGVGLGGMGDGAR